MSDVRSAIPGTRARRRARRSCALPTLGARRYSPRERYAEGQVLDHPQFGRGFVSALRDGGKLEVTFRGETAVQTYDGTQGWKLRPIQVLIHAASQSGRCALIPRAGNRRRSEIECHQK